MPYWLLNKTTFLHFKNLFFIFSSLRKRFIQLEKKDCLFVEIHNFQAFLDQVRKQTHITFVGVPGSGKTGH